MEDNTLNIVKLATDHKNCAQVQQHIAGWGSLEAIVKTRLAE